MRGIIRSAAVAAFVIVAAAPASAGAAPPSWSAVNSGTSENITAIEHGGDRAWFATSNGKIFRRVGGGGFAQVLSAPGVVFNDLEFQGDVGLAVGNAGAVYRSTNGGQSWAKVSTLTSNDVDCKTDKPLGNVSKVAFAKPDVVFVFGDRNQILRSNNGGASWENANRDTSPDPDICRVDYDARITGAFFVADAADVTGYVMTIGFGQTYFTANNFLGAQNKGEHVNGFETTVRLAGDPANPNRQWALATDEALGSYWSRTEDGWTDESSLSIVNDERRNVANAEDLTYAGGTVLIAGEDGMILNSVDGGRFFFVDDGANPSTNWGAADLADGGRALIGGEGGRLIETANANSIPDVVAPTLSIGGPTSAPEDQPVTFGSQAADDPGGSGIDPATYTWTVSGLPNQGGPTPTFTFPNPGSYTVRATVRDREGNLSNVATHSITIRRATPPPPPPPPPAPPVASFSTDNRSRPTARRKKGKVIVKVRGKVTAPGTRSCAGKIRITVSKGKKRLARKTVKVKPRTCAYKKTIKIKRRKVGKTKRLKVLLSYLPANRSELSPTRISYTTRVR